MDADVDTQCPSVPPSVGLAWVPPAATRTGFHHWTVSIWRWLWLPLMENALPWTVSISRDMFSLSHLICKRSRHSLPGQDSRFLFFFSSLLSCLYLLRAACGISWTHLSPVSLCTSHSSLPWSTDEDRDEIQLFSLHTVTKASTDTWLLSCFFH